MRVHHRHLRFLAVPLLLVAALAGAEEKENNSWLENTIATCIKEHGETLCQDREFLNENYHVDTLQIAHRAAIRGNREEQRALREVVLQQLCDKSPEKSCTGSGNRQCVAQVSNLCANMNVQAAQCVARVEQMCANNAMNNCKAKSVTQCPSAKKQKIAVLLSKYPRLSPEQKHNVALVAQGLEKQNAGLVDKLLGWLGF